ncbi:MAG: sigma-54-dependent transcriptional regulator [Acidiferrobacterales bacterium]
MHQAVSSPSHDDSVQTRVPESAVKRRMSILIVDDEPGMCKFLQRALAEQFGLVETAGSIADAEELRQRYRFDLMLVDIRLPDGSGLDWIGTLRKNNEIPDVIFITAYAEMDATIQAVRFGASDFILKPFRLEQVIASIDRWFERLQLTQKNQAYRRHIDGLVDRIYGNRGMVGHSEPMQLLNETIRQVAATPSSILIEGETGTGKELAALAIHRHSGRNESFVAINCAGIPADLFESELFGHKKGAFTGASTNRQGMFHLANGGTIFLDEISEMPETMQAKLLRVIEERKIRPVGSDREIAVDVRLIAASNRDLREEVNSGRFREDLYYRLNVMSLRMPPLRDRTEDIPELVEHFTQNLAESLGVKPFHFSANEIARLQAYDWPGNVRELRNVVERALLLSRFPGESIAGSINQRSDGPQQEDSASGPSIEWTLAEVEKFHMVRVLEAAEGNKSEAARRLGVSRKTMERKLREWNEDARGQR